MNELRIEELGILIRAHNNWRKESVRSAKCTQRTLNSVTYSKHAAAALLKEHQEHTHNHVKRIAKYTERVAHHTKHEERLKEELADYKGATDLHTARVAHYKEELKELKKAKG